MDIEHVQRDAQRILDHASPSGYQNMQVEHHDARVLVRRDELRHVGLRVLLLAIAIALSAAIALLTPSNSHPDEYLHVDAVRYFQDHLWPPPLGSDDVIYSSYGWSRVYSGEVAYLVYGILAHAFSSLGIKLPLITLARFFNVTLFGVALGTLLFVSSRSMSPAVVGYVLLVIPQVYYIFSYVNSDGWGLAMSLLLFVFALRLHETPLETWSFRQVILVSGLTGCVLAGKTNFALGIVIPYALLLYSIMRSLRVQRVRRIPSRFLVMAGSWILMVFLIAAPLKVVYPLTQGDFSGGVQAMREEKARPGFKPGDPYFTYMRLKEKGHTYWTMLSRFPWLTGTASSFWGTFGYMDIPNPHWVYIMAFLLGFMAFILTAVSFVRSYGDLSPGLKICFFLAPVVLAINIYGSLYHSLYIDFQAQGRYLFASLIPVSILTAGTLELDSGLVRKLRKGVFLLLYGLTLFSLLIVGLPQMIS